MNKNLESEYQNMIRAEVPDIWDKIEAKIDAQEAQKKIVTFKKKTSKWKYYVVPAAAALICVAIAIPVITNSRMANESAPASTQSTATGGAAAAMDQAACAESVDMEMTYEEPIYDESAYDEKKNEGKQTSMSIGQGLVNYSSGTTAGDAAATSENSDKSDRGADTACEAEEASGGEYRYAVYTVKVPVSIPGEVVEKIAESLGLQIEDQNADEGVYVLVTKEPVSTAELIEIGKMLEANEHIAEVSAEAR